MSTVSQHFANNVQATESGQLTAKRQLAAPEWAPQTSLDETKPGRARWPTDCRACGMYPGQMGSHFQIFPELEDKCTWPEANEVD